MYPFRTQTVANLQPYCMDRKSAKQREDDHLSACRLIKISSVAHTIGLVWRHFDRVTSKWFSIEEAFI